MNERKFSISDFLLITTAIGVAFLLMQMVWPYRPGSRGSADSQGAELVWRAVFVVGLLLFSSLIAFSKWSSSERFVAQGIFLILVLMLIPGWHLLSWGLLGIVVVFLSRQRVRSRTVNLQMLVGWLIVATLSGNLLNHFYPSRRVRLLLEARNAYPVIDLSPRLSRLSTTLVSAKTATRSEQPESSLGNELSRFYANSRKRNYRTDALQKIHSQEYESFVRSLGFGSMRMVPMSRMRVDLPELVDIPFEGMEFDYETKEELDRSLKTLQAWNGDAGDQGERYEFDSPLTSTMELLKHSHLNFLNPDTFGWAMKTGKVSGFEPHAFRFPINEVEVDSRSYRIQRLELIGILTSDKPRVYVLDHLPRMDQIAQSDIKTRELNEFEATALEKLYAGEELVVVEQPRQIKMVGALRSFENCANCHDSKTGDLMGAFSYELVR